MPIPWSKRCDRVKQWEETNKNEGRLPYWNDRARWLNIRVKKFYGRSETVTGEELQELYDLSSKKCFYCGCPVAPSQVHFDHMDSLNAGGRHEVSNMCVSCQDCNLAKATSSIDDFLSKVYESELPENIYSNLFEKGCCRDEMFQNTMR